MHYKMSIVDYYESTTNFSYVIDANESYPGSASKEINDTFPDELRFNQNSLTVVLIYSALFVISGVGNLTVFVSLFRSRHRKSRISLMIRHLAIADLVVTFVMIPIEVSWRLTVQWLAGNLACKVFLFLRAFGLYLSSNVLVCVSLDRYFAVLHPLKVNDARRRGKFMLGCAWGISLLYSVPQSVVFHVSAHPKYPSFLQCVTFGFFTSDSQEIAYNLFCVMAMYFIPLLVIVVAYTAIMCEISNKSKDSVGASYHTSNGRMRLRRSDISNIERARSRTLKMTVIIVLVFIWCWTPYVVMTLWYMFDRESAANVPNWLQDALFMMAVSNSCMNPLVYGSYAINFRRELCKCLQCFRSKEPQNNFTYGEAALAARRGGLARRVIKCVLTLQIVGSGATKSTVVVQGVVAGNTNLASPKNTDHTVTRRKFRHTERPPSVGHISFLSEPQPVHSYHSTFHSEPCPCPCVLPDERSLEASYNTPQSSGSATGIV